MTERLEPRPAYVVMAVTTTSTRVVLFDSLRVVLVTHDVAEAGRAARAVQDGSKNAAWVILEHGASRRWLYVNSYGIDTHRQPHGFLATTAAYLAPADYWALMDAVRHVSDPELDERSEAGAS